MRINSTVACTKLELKKAQENYKLNLYWILKFGNANIKMVRYIWMDVREGK